MRDAKLERHVNMPYQEVISGRHIRTPAQDERAPEENINAWPAFRNDPNCTDRTDVAAMARRK